MVICLQVNRTTRHTGEWKSGLQNVRGGRYHSACWSNLCFKHRFECHSLSWPHAASSDASYRSHRPTGAERINSGPSALNQPENRRSRCPVRTLHLRGHALRTRKCPVIDVANDSATVHVKYLRYLSH